MFHPSQLELKQLKHRLLMTKSAAFMKIILATDSKDSLSQCSSSNCLGYPKVQTILEVASKVARERRRGLVKAALEKIKQAGWKIIPEVDEDDEYSIDLGQIDLKKVSNVSTMVPIDYYKVRTVEGPIETESVHYVEQHEHYYLEKENYQPNIRSSGKFSGRRQGESMDYERRMKRRKRAIIMSRLDSIEMCTDYIRVSNRRQIKHLLQNMHS